MNHEAVAEHSAWAARRRRRAIIFGVASALVAAGAVPAFIFAFSGRAQPRPWVMVSLMVLAVAVIILFVVAIHHAILATRHAMAAALASRGLDASATFDKTTRLQLFAPFAHLPFLRHDAKGIRFWAGGDVDALRIDLIEHHYVVHTGKSAHAVRHIVAATPCPPAWPSVSLSPRNFITGWWADVRGHDLRLESDSFNKRWIVKTVNQDFAMLLLSPEVQAYLAEGPTGESWQIGTAQICWIAKKSLKPANVAIPVDRLTGLVALIPPELHHWGSDS